MNHDILKTTDAGPDREASGSVDEDLYAAARPHLRAALEHTIDAGRSVRDFADFCVERFGSAVLPYLQRFAAEVRARRIRVPGCDAGTFDVPSDPGKGTRESWIREAAYFRAERRGFAPGAAEQDWLEAEREVDERIARDEQPGPLDRGLVAVASLRDFALEGFANLRESLARWLDERSAGRQGEAG
jgi:hypothetical protein